MQRSSSGQGRQVFILDIAGSTPARCTKIVFVMENLLINDVPVKMWAKTLDGHAWQEVVNICSLPFMFHHFALMPDAHGGKGMPIGGVLATKDVVVPNAVGVDIGCGMCAVKTNIRVEEMTGDILRKGILRDIRKRIPLGMEHHKTAQDENRMPKDFDIDSMTVVKRQYTSALKQLGTLGGGNHFIEIQKDNDGFVWIMLHSGSRNLGKKVCDYYDEKAQNLNKMWHSAINLDSKLAFLPKYSREFHDYWNEMNYCVEFALANRQLMMERIQEIFQNNFPHVIFEPMINIAHNYAAWEHHFDEDVIVHRKGAVRASLGTIGIIPGSQGTKSYIVEGLGHPDSFESSSHGAGRLLSRTAAVNTLSLDDEIKRLEEQGIVHAIRNRKDLEEAAGAYKNIEEVMANQTDLVKIITELSPMAVVKGL